jgi:hypothetical protein
LRPPRGRWFDGYATHMISPVLWRLI